MIVSTCFGGGGFLAMAFGVGVVDGLVEAGVPVPDGHLLGTSGGAWAAGAVALGLPLDDVVQAAATGKRSGVPQCDITAEVFGHGRDARVRATAVELRTGRLRVLPAAEHGLGDVIGASSSAPGLFPPYRIGGRRYVDGGLYSPTSAHLAAGADLLVVVASMSGPLLPPLGRMFGGMAGNESRLWRLRHRGRVLVLRPDAGVVAAAGRGFGAVLDPDRAALVRRRAREAALRAVERTALPLAS